MRQMDKRKYFTMINVDSLHRKEAREEAGQKAKQAFEAKGMTKISTIVYCK